MGDTPCKTCSKRGCGAYHDSCHIYKDWKNESEHVKNIKRHNHMINSDRDFRINHMQKRTHHDGYGKYS